MRVIYFIFLIFTLSACVQQAEHEGKVFNASTGMPMSGVNVTLRNFCVYDSFNNCIDKADLTMVTDSQGKLPKGSLGAPSSGHEAITLEFKKAGYSTVNRYLTPNYENGAVPDFGEIYLCPQNAQDSDQDGICNLAESHYGTLVNNSDSDGDRVSDTAELFGYKGIDLVSLGANPLRKTVFFKLIYFTDNLFLTRSTIPLPVLFNSDKDARFNRYRDKGVEMFQNASVQNIDGSTGIDLVMEIERLNSSDLPAESDSSLDLSRNGILNSIFRDNVLDPVRAEIYRLGIIKPASGWVADKISDLFGPSTFAMAPFPDSLDDYENLQRTGGKTMLLNGQSVITDGYLTAATIYHELGHLLGLYHGGIDVNAPNAMEHHFSIMNYYYSGGAYDLSGNAAYISGRNAPLFVLYPYANRDSINNYNDYILDYSSYSHTGFNEQAIIETEILQPTGSTVGDNTKFGIARHPGVTPVVDNSKISRLRIDRDLNKDGVINSTAYAKNLYTSEMEFVQNITQLTEIPGTVNEWEHLVFDGDGWNGVKLGDDYLQPAVSARQRVITGNPASWSSINGAINYCSGLQSNEVAQSYLGY